MEIEKIGACVVIRMNRGENRFNPDSVKAFIEALDKAESYEDAKALVTIGEGKYYSLGMDLDRMATMPGRGSYEFVSEIQKLLARLLTFPLVTIAAINGHVYAGGAALALAHDYRIMRNDRGWFCLPEINLNLPFPVFTEFFKAIIPVSEHKLAVALGKRYTGEEAKAAGIVNELSSLEELKESALAAAERLAGDGLDRKSLTTMKLDLYKDVYKALNEPLKFSSKI